MIYVML